MFPDDKEKDDQIRCLLKILILNTDMVFHFDMVTKLMNVVDYQPNLEKSKVLEELPEDISINLFDSFQSLQSQKSSTTDLDHSSSLDLVVTENMESRNLLISAILHAAGTFVFYLIIRYK